MCSGYHCASLSPCTVEKLKRGLEVYCILQEAAAQPWVTRVGKELPKSSKALTSFFASTWLCFPALTVVICLDIFFLLTDCSNSAFYKHCHPIKVPAVSCSCYVRTLPLVILEPKTSAPSAPSREKLVTQL